MRRIVTLGRATCPQRAGARVPPPDSDRQDLSRKAEPGAENFRSQLRAWHRAVMIGARSNAGGFSWRSLRRHRRLTPHECDDEGRGIGGDVAFSAPES